MPKFFHLFIINKHGGLMYSKVLTKCVFLTDLSILSRTLKNWGDLMICLSLPLHSMVLMLSVPYWLRYLILKIEIRMICIIGFSFRKRKQEREYFPNKNPTSNCRCWVFQITLLWNSYRSKVCVDCWFTSHSSRS